MNGMSVVHGYGSRNSARNSDSQRLEKILVRRGIEQAVDIGGVGRLHLPHPTLVVGVVVEDLGAVAKLGVVGDPLAGDRRIDIARRLDGLDHREAFILDKPAAGGGRFHKYPTTTRALPQLG